MLSDRTDRGIVGVASASLTTKVDLRLKALPPDDASVLDCFSGEGHLWRVVARRHPGEVRTFRIDRRRLLGIDWVGDCLDFLRDDSDLGRFNVIDLDAYGWPCRQLETVTEAGFSGTVVATFASVGVGRVPRCVIEAGGLPASAHERASSVVLRRQSELLRAWVESLGWRVVDWREHRSQGAGKAHYLTLHRSSET